MKRQGSGVLLQQQGLSVGSRMVLRCKAGTVQGLWSMENSLLLSITSTCGNGHDPDVMIRAQIAVSA